MATVAKTFTLDDEVIDLKEFLRDNRDAECISFADIVRMDVGDEMTFGGGAAPTRVLKRVR